MVSPVYIKPLLALLVIAAMIGIVVVVLRDDHHRSDQVRSGDQQLPHNIDVALKQAQFSEIQDGAVVWKLVAERVDYDRKGDTAYLSAVLMEFPHSRTCGAVTVTADSGEYLSAKKIVRLKGHVHVVTEDGASFKTSSIVYTGVISQFSTNDPITFQQQRLLLNAVGMDFGVKKQQAHFYSAVAASISMN